MDNTEMATILRNAAGEIQDRGLARYTQMDYDGTVCIAGALGIAMGKNPRGRIYPCEPVSSFGMNSEESLVWRRLERVMRENLGLEWTGDPANWNNTVAQDADEVAHVLKLAAEEIELG